MEVLVEGGRVPKKKLQDFLLIKKLEAQGIVLKSERDFIVITF